MTVKSMVKNVNCQNLPNKNTSNFQQRLNHFNDILKCIYIFYFMYFFFKFKTLHNLQPIISLHFGKQNFYTHSNCIQFYYTVLLFSHKHIANRLISRQLGIPSAFSNFVAHRKNERGAILSNLSFRPPQGFIEQCIAGKMPEKGRKRMERFQ